MDGYTVTFPNLGFEFNINPTAFTIFGLEVKWYGILIAIGFLLAFLYALASCKKMHIDQDKLIDVVIVGIIAGIIGARLYYVLFYAGDRYIRNPMSIFNITEGGLGIYGGIIGGIGIGALMAKIRKMKITPVLDVASLGFLIGQCIGRWGNFVNQEAFGRATDLPWAMSSENTVIEVGGAAHPCFLYESLWCLMGFILLHIFTRKLRRYDGQTFLLYVVWYGVGRFFIEGLRTDSLLTPFLDLRVSQLVAAVSVLAAVILLVVFRNRTSLTGCGSKKVMELNHIDDGTEEQVIYDGPSTIFEGEDMVTDDGSDALENNDNEEEEEMITTVQQNDEFSESESMADVSGSDANFESEGDSDGNED